MPPTGGLELVQLKQTQQSLTSFELFNTESLNQGLLTRVKSEKVEPAS